MQIRFGRAIIAAMAAEILGVAILAVLVAIFGPPGFEAAQPFAERLGQWVGPISGFGLCILGGWWTAKAAPADAKVRNGLAMGIIAALLDAVIALALSPVFSWLLVISNLGRIIGGWIGGTIAARKG